ncbi:OmpH family outer membrane protein [Tropicimonas sp. IMCC6043]|uniref:OmpH family outer membrane protein n=1 Tax=Tropicimonas sp. IMCC6043 TaxID=2510645 RepID=UPI00101CA04B|nr:OmpH family outer membrane protein [Tropicimonas sp. IMCC6043]RYH10339.1 OmpH family outer membrane protein [Tropicimonas sp. IMCC6043]
MAWRRRLGSAIFIAAVALPTAPVPAQVFSPTASLVLTLDQDKLYAETLFGKRIQAEIADASQELAERNRVLSEQLTTEEKALTEKRKEVAPEEFRALADAFDEKVVKLREEQDAKIEALQRRRDLERRVFTGRILPILSEIVQSSGAVAILDDRAVILSADSIDITDRAIRRIDEVLGDGSALEDQGSDAPASDQSAD